MPHNSPRLPQRRPSNPSIKTNLVGHGHSYIGDQNVASRSSHLRIPFLGEPLPVSPDFLVRDVPRPAAAPTPIIAGFSYDADWSAHQGLGNGTFSGPFAQFPCRLDGTTPTCSPSALPFLLSAGGCTGHDVYNLGPQHPLISTPSSASWAYTASLPENGNLSPYASRLPPYPQSSLGLGNQVLSMMRRTSSAISLPETENLSPYRCLDCPNMPAFGSQKDLDRHRTNKVHWGEETKFYRCCCDAYKRPRKDHHLRHVQLCDAQAIVPYACICGAESWVRGDHVEHVVDCGRIRRRRQSSAP